RSPSRVNEVIGAQREAPLFLAPPTSPHPHAFRAVDATFTALMTDLKRSLRTIDGLAMVVGIMVGSGIFRTPGLVAAYLGRPALTFVALILGGVVALLGALCFAELSTR